MSFIGTGLVNWPAGKTVFSYGSRARAPLFLLQV